MWTFNDEEMIFDKFTAFNLANSRPLHILNNDL